MPMNHYARIVDKLDAELFPARRRTRLMQGARRYIDRHYRRDIGLADMAARACLTEYYFIRLFRRYYGRTPGQYLREVRLRHARELLVQGWSVTATCMAVGYSSSASFSLLFTRAAGMPPSRYRKAILDKRPDRGLPIIDRWSMARRSPNENQSEQRPGG